MRLLGNRASLATMGLGFLAALIGVIGTGSDGPGSSRYEVSAPVLSVRGGPVYACFATLLSLPPAGCGGVLVRGLDTDQVLNVQVYRDGTLMTPPLRLVGAWDGHALTLTESPRPAASETALPEPCTQEPGTESVPGVPPRQVQVGNDQALLESRGIIALETVSCGDTLGIAVAVADPDTVRYLESRYGRVSVTGWLRPLPSGP